MTTPNGDHVIDLRRLFRRRPHPAAAYEPPSPSLPAWTADEAERAAFVELVNYCETNGIRQFTMCTRDGQELAPSRKLEIMREIFDKIREAEANDPEEIGSTS